MLTNEDLRQQLEVIADQSQSVTLMYWRLQQFESEVNELRRNVVEFKATIYEQAELIAAQQALISELIASVKVQAQAGTRHLA